VALEYFASYTAINIRANGTFLEKHRDCPFLQNCWGGKSPGAAGWSYNTNETGWPINGNAPSQYSTPNSLSSFLAQKPWESKASQNQSTPYDRGPVNGPLPATALTGTAIID